MPLPKIFKPNKSDLVRCGSVNDGGYLLTKKTIKNSQSLISFGILDDCSFEKDFNRINKVNTICFDQINYNSYWKKRFYNDIGACIYNLNIKDIKETFLKYVKFKKFFKLNNIFLYKKNIQENDLTKIIENNKNIIKPFFLKIDIEGSEYRLLNEIIENKKFITGLVIEFHDLDLHLSKVINFIEKLNFKITHVHGNNFARQINKLPLVLEMTFERDPDFHNTFAELPNKFDAPCNPLKDEIELTFE